MAEGIVNDRLGDRWEAFSAGSCPAGYVHALTNQVLSEIGIEHHGRSKSVAEFFGQPFDLVVTLCDDSEEECPIWLGLGMKLHCPFPDPGKTPGGEAENLRLFAW